jgi:class 3 adenylate cyclase
MQPGPKARAVLVLSAAPAVALLAAGLASTHSALLALFVLLLTPAVLAPLAHNYERVGAKLREKNDRVLLEDCESGMVAVFRRLYRHLPADPRCRLCLVPFGGLGRLLRITPSRKNRNFCTSCIDSSPEGVHEMEVGVLFADIRGYTAWSSPQPPGAAADLVSQFYAAGVREADEEARGCGATHPRGQGQVPARTRPCPAAPVATALAPPEPCRYGVGVLPKPSRDPLGAARLAAATEVSVDFPSLLLAVGLLCSLPAGVVLVGVIAHRAGGGAKLRRWARPLAGIAAVGWGATAVLDWRAPGENPVLSVVAPVVAMVGMVAFAIPSAGASRRIAAAVFALGLLACAAAPDASAFQVGMSRRQIVSRFGQPQERQVLVKSEAQIWGPIESFWSSVPEGGRVEIWSYAAKGGTVELYFVDESPEVRGTGFAPAGAVF